MSRRGEWGESCEHYFLAEVTADEALVLTGMAQKEVETTASTTTTTGQSRQAGRGREIMRLFRGDSREYKYGRTKELRDSDRDRYR